MKTIKEALWLTRFELKSIRLRQIILLVTLLGIAIYLIRFTIIRDDFQIDLGLDPVLMVTLILFQGVLRAKGFPTQKIAGSFYASPNILHLQTLPIPKRSIALYRLLIQMILSSLIVIVVFISMYDVLQTEIDMMSYIHLAFFWICFGVLFGRIEATDEAGFDMYESILRRIGLIVLFLFVYFSVTFFLLPSGLVQSSFQLAHDKPFLLYTISFVLLALSVLSTYRFIKKMHQTDYITSR